MKRLNILPTVLISAGLIAASCTNLDENLKDTITADKYFKTQSEIDAAVIAPYGSLTSNFGHNGYFTLQELPTDEAMIPQRGGDWGDGGQPVSYHIHTYNPKQDAINGLWTAAFGAISAVNRLLSTPQLTDAKAIAELKCLRAYNYWIMMDNYGNVPLTTKLGENQGQKTQAELYAFIESEITTSISLLDKTPNYGRINYYAAQAVLAKLYLNAKVYTGTAQWDKAIAACDAIINSGLYNLEPNYSDVFKTLNNNSPEIIWQIPFDHVYAPGFNLDAMTLHYSSQDTYKTTFQPWNGYCSLEEFYNSYDNTDVRKKNNFLVGPQYKADGVTPITDASYETKGVDGDPNAIADPDGAPVNFTPHVNELYPNALRQSGARIGKFQFALGTTENLDNDMPLYRYADILLTKAEALFWKSNWTDGTALALTNMVHQRAGLPAYTTMTQDEFLAERGREMFAEAWRRNDLIRFGVYGSKLWFGKTAPDAADGHLNIFPIPLAQINATAGQDGALKQNPGY